jgi:hypothetical protein
MDDKSDFVDDDLTPAEREMFADARGRVDLPGHLEDRVVHALHARGLLAEQRRSRRPAWLVGSIAAGLIAFAAGVVVGRSTAQPVGEANTVIAPSDSLDSGAPQTASQTGSVEVWF